MDSSEVAILLDGIFEKAGFTNLEVRTCREEILDAEWRGKASFGLELVPELVKIYAKKKGEPRLVRDTGAAMFIEGNDGPGPTVATYAMDLALDAVERQGVIWVGVRNRWPWMTAGFHLRRAAQAGYLAMTWSAGVAIVAPYGGKRRVFGTNPFGWAAPSVKGPIVFDAAMTAGHASVLRDAKRQGVRLPEGVAIDVEGRPTRDPDEGREGAMLPIAGHRGTGLSMMIELFGGAWVGAKTGLRFKGSRGFVYVLATTGLFGFGDGFRNLAEGLVDDVQAATEPGAAHIPGRPAADFSQPREIDDGILARLHPLRP